VSNSIVILYRGNVAEAGDVDAVIKNPQHPYTQELVGSIPLPDPGSQWMNEDDSMETEAVDSATHQVKTGCKYAPRCPHVMDRCREAFPPLYQLPTGQVATCYLYDDAPKLTDADLTTVLHNRAETS
jgi:peptide/nickel transport system ATP-binding protein